MAVPKKRNSKTRTKTRKAVWKRQAQKASLKAFSLAKSLLKEKQTSFLYEESIKVFSEPDNTDSKRTTIEREE